MVEFKTLPQYFEAVVSGKKTFEFRHDNKGAVVGDTLLLREWDAKKEEYTGREISRLVTYALNLNAWGSVGFILGFGYEFGEEP